MRAARAFTLIETMICLAILAVLFLPLMTMVEGIASAHARSLRLATLRSDLDRVGFRVQALLSQPSGAQASSYSISADNSGVALSAGKSLRWQGQNLVLAERGREVILARDVTHFSLFRRDGLTTVTLELRDPASAARERKQYLVVGGDVDATRL